MANVVLTFLAVMIVAAVDDRPVKPKPEKCKLPEVRDELSRRVKQDQKLRREVVKKVDPKAEGTESPQQELITRLLKVDAANTRWLQAQVEKHGWLGRSLVGKQGAKDAWLLVQHADQKPKFQRRCLDLMKAMPRDEVSGANLAYLTDRVLLAEGKPQRYGTQCIMRNSKVTLRKVEDRDNLDKRRKSVGLPPVEEYLRLVEKMHAADKKRKSKK